MGLDFYKEYLGELIEIQTQDKLHISAADQNQLSVMGYCRVLVQLKRFKIKGRFFIVKEMQGKIIIGNELLIKMEAVIDLSQCEMKIKEGTIIPLQVHNSNEEWRMVVLETSILPPQSQSLVKCQVMEQQNLITKCLVKMENHTDKQRLLRKNQQIYTISQEYQEVNEVEKGIYKLQEIINLNEENKHLLP